MLKKTATKMDLMEKIDVDNQMTILQDAVMEEGAQDITDEVEDLSNSLREIVKDEAVKPKLHCLMMDPDFSMVTMQSEDSGIVWETPSSRCSTPWSSEFSSAHPEPCYSLVPKHSGPEAAGKIIFIMDEDHMISRKKRKRNKAEEKVKNQSELMSEEPERPAMVEVSLPNMKLEEESETEERKDPKEEGNQRLFRLLSEGSEILNIIAPPKIFTVDEEESKDLADNLAYLEDAPVIKSKDITEEEAEASEEIQTENLQASIQAEPEPILLSPIKLPRKGASSEDYFEKFTLLDHQAPAGSPMVEALQEPEVPTEEVVNEGKDNAVVAKPDMETSAEPVSGLDIATEHVDDVFYGGGGDPDRQSIPRDNANKEWDLPKSPLKESGSALFGSQESILTPIFLPEGPPKIIDPNLLEEPKALAFLYSDLYADAVGTGKKQDDTESLTSEKSFHSQESDLGDRGYLEKFVLKDETPVTEEVQFPEDRKAVRVRMWSEDAFGVPRQTKVVTGAKGNEDEVTDFFRDSACSSPCESIGLERVEPEETRKETKPRRVFFKDDAPKVDQRTEEAGNDTFLPSEEDIEIAEAFLPLDISTEVETSWVSVDDKFAIAERAAKIVSVKPTKPEKMKRVKAPKEHLSIRPPQTVKPITPCHKPFLDLTPLLPAEEEAEGHKEMDAKQEDVVDASVCSCTASPAEATGEALDYELITQQEYTVPQSDSPREGSDNGGFTMVEYPSQLDDLYDTVEADYEIVDSPVS